MLSFIRSNIKQNPIKRPLETGTGVPDGVSIIREWTELSGSGGYFVFEKDKSDYVWTMAWNNLLDMEIFQSQWIQVAIYPTLTGDYQFAVPLTMTPLGMLVAEALHTVQHHRFQMHFHALT